jgi:hypothetical protein
MPKRSNSRKRSTIKTPKASRTKFSNRKLSRSEEDKIFRNDIKKRLKKFGSDLRMPSVWFHPVTGNQVSFSSRAKRVFRELRKEMGIKGPEQYGSKSRKSKKSKSRKSNKSKSRKSNKSKSRKSNKRGRRKALIRSRTRVRKIERVKRSARGCSRQSTSKYSSRKSPPFPANNCCGSIKKGNDGNKYRSKRASNGICRWVKE